MTLSHGRHISFAMSLVSLFTWGCDTRGADPAGIAPRVAPAASVPYRVVHVVNGGRLVGSVTWVGPRPAVVTLPVVHHAEVCGAEQRVMSLEVGPRGGIANTVVVRGSRRRALRCAIRNIRSWRRNLGAKSMMRKAPSGPSKRVSRTFVFGR
jgi:hypothetical protein